jgi:hypothetical protein
LGETRRSPVETAFGHGIGSETGDISGARERPSPGGAPAPPDTDAERAVWLAYDMGFTYPVATILGIAEGTAKAQLGSALHRLHCLVADDPLAVGAAYR